MFTALGNLAYKRRWHVLVSGLIFVLVSGFFGYNASQFLKVGGFIDPESESSTATSLAALFLGRDQGQLVVLFNSKNGATFDQPEYRKEVEAILAKINRQTGVGSIFTIYNTGLPQFISNDKLSSYAVVGLSGNDDTQVHSVERLRPLLQSTTSLQVRLGGRPAVNEEIVKQSEIDLMRAELMTFPVIGILLLLIFQSAIAAILPLVIGGTAIIGAYLILRISSNAADISVFSLNIITMVGLGLSIDYSLFVVSRFREELAIHNGNVHSALVRTMQTAGHTVFFSGLTVIISLLSLLVFSPPFLKSMGFGGAMAVLVAMAAAVTILPAILAVFGERINSLSVNKLLRRRRTATKKRVEDTPDSKDFWYRSSNFVMRHPVLVLVGILTPLLLLGSPFLRINFSTFDARTLPTTHESRQVSDYLNQHFPPNETAPIELVVWAPASILNPINRISILDPENLNNLFDYTRQLQALPSVRRVDSLVTIDPSLDKAAYAQFYSPAGLAANPQAAQLAQRFARDNYTSINVIYQDDQHASSTQDLVRNIRNLKTPPHLLIVSGGETASLVDLLSSLAHSLPLAFGLVVGILFVLLFLMLGSLVVPLKAVLLNILSLSASFGTLVLIFQDGNFSDLLNFTPTGAVDSIQPVLIFAGAFGLSLDYEVFLLSRIKEHYNRTKDLRASVALGVHKTGGIITSAAILLVVVIASFITGEVLFIKQVGVGLAIAILVDATIVRTFLLPATMRLMGRYNWWAPAPLVKLHNKLGLSEKEPELEAVPVPVAIPGPRLKPDVSPLPPQPKFPQVRPASAEPANIVEIPPAGSIVNNKLPTSKTFPQAAHEVDKEELFDLIKKELVSSSGKAELSNTKIHQLNQLAELCKSMGRENEAVEYYEQSLKLMRETGFDEQNQVIVLTHLSNLFLELQVPPRGVPVSLVGIQLSRRTNQAAAEFTFLSNLVDFSLKLQELKQARSFAWQAFQLAQLRSDDLRVRRAERMLASVEACEELQFKSQGLPGFQTISGGFKSMTGQFNFISRPPQPTGPVPDVIKQAETLYRQGKQLQNEKDYYQAIEVYSQAIAFNPRLVNAYFNRAVSFKAIGEADKALKDYNQALEIEPNDPDIWINRGNIFFLKKDYNQAVQDYTQAITLNPNDPDGYFNRADAFRLQGQMVQAVADLHKFIDLMQNDDPAAVRQARNILSKIEEKVINKSG